MAGLDEGTDQPRADAHPHHREPHAPSEFSDIGLCVAPEFMPPQMAPDPPVGVEFEQVARELVDLEAGLGGEETSPELRAVVGSAVPEYENRSTADVPQQVAEERDHLWPTDRSLVDAEVEAAPRRHTTDRRELRPPALMEQHRRLADGRPGLRYVGNEREPHFRRQPPLRPFGVGLLYTVARSDGPSLSPL